LLDGVKTADLLVASYETDPEIAVPWESIRVKVEEVIVVESIAFENTAEIEALRSTPLASLEGEVEIIVGAVLSDVVKLQVTGKPSCTPTVSLIVAASVAVYVVKELKLLVGVKVAVLVELL